MKFDFQKEPNQRKAINVMKAKDYLKRLRKLDVVIKQKKHELTDLRKEAQCVSGIDYSREKVQSSHSSEAPFVPATEKIIELEKEINAEIKHFVEEKHMIISQIQGLNDPRHIDMLYKRYVEFKRLEMIAAEMDYTCQYARELHGSALQDFEKTYKNLLKSYIDM